MGLVLRAGVLVGLGVVSGLLLNHLRPDGVVLAPPVAAAACLVAPDFPSAPDRVDPMTAQTLCADPTVLVADARGSLRFAEGHVAGAVHLPCAASSDVAQTVPTLLQGKSMVIVYGDTTAEAEQVADGLRRRSRDPALRVVVLDGGFSAWENAGLACASGACPECSEGLHGHGGDHVTPSEGLGPR